MSTLRVVVRIAYADQYVDTMNYFRAVYASGEMSRRALDLTEEAIDLNGANYTVWHYRWELAMGLGVDVNDELGYAEAMAVRNPKNYQVWNHMRLCVAALGTTEVAARSLAFVAENALAADAKNYHAWSHRAWIVRTFANRWAEELAYVEAMIDDDVRNNSAWNQRFVCVVESGRLDDGGGGADAEIAFAEARVERAPDNESAWNYLRGVLRHDGVGWSHGGHGERIARMYVDDARGEGRDAAEAEAGDDETKAGPSGRSPNRHAMSLLTEVRLAEAAAGAGTAAGAAAAAEAADLLARLAAVDPVRANYYAFRRAHVLGNLAGPGG